MRVYEIGGARCDVKHLAEGDRFTVIEMLDGHPVPQHLRDKELIAIEHNKKKRFLVCNDDPYMRGWGLSYGIIVQKL